MLNDYKIPQEEIKKLFKNIDTKLRILNKMRTENGELTKKLTNKNWHIVNYVIDNILYSIKAIKYYFNKGLGTNIAIKHLKFYGLISSINIQQNAISELYKILGKNYNTTKEISNLCNYVILKPLNSNSDGFCYTISPYFDNYSVSIAEFDVNKLKEKEIKPPTRYTKILFKHLEEVDKCLTKFLDTYLYP